MKFLVSVIVAAFALACAAAMFAAPAENPVPVRTVKPEYPRELRQDGVTGVVLVKCTIDEQGNVSDALVVKSSNEKFDAAALDALKKWKFKPARQDGKPVVAQVNIPIKFVVQES